MLLEICCTRASDALQAQRAGAHRIELCYELECGGLTPHAAGIRSARRLLSVPLHVMIRPRPGNYHFSTDEFNQMLNDIQTAKSCGADGIVTGLLTASRDVDSLRLERLVEIAYPLPVTFHRAFDETENPFESLEKIISCGCRTLLTSGQQPRATEGAALIRKLQTRANSRIEIMAGSGITDMNILPLAEKTGVRHFHASARIVINEKKTMSIFMIQQMVQKLNSLK